MHAKTLLYNLQPMPQSSTIHNYFIRRSEKLNKIFQPAEAQTVMLWPRWNVLGRVIWCVLTVQPALSGLSRLSGTACTESVSLHRWRHLQFWDLKKLGAEGWRTCLIRDAPPLSCRPACWYWITHTAMYVLHWTVACNTGPQPGRSLSKKRRHQRFRYRRTENI